MFELQVLTSENSAFNIIFNKSFLRLNLLSPHFVSSLEPTERFENVYVARVHADKHVDNAGLAATNDFML